MPLTYREIIKEGILNELANVFSEETPARILLMAAGFETGMIPPFNNRMEFWDNVCREINNGIINGGFESVLSEAARQYPHNQVFSRFLSASSQSMPGTHSKPGNNTGHDVFISYSRKDKDFVRDIALKLENQSIKSYIDYQDINAGIPFSPQLEHVLSVAPAIGVFVGIHGLGPWQQAEVQAVYDRAFRGECKLIPVLLPGVKAGDLPLFLKNFQCISIIDPNDPAAIDRLVNAIKGKP